MRLPIRFQTKTRPVKKWHPEKVITFGLHNFREKKNEDKNLAKHHKSKTDDNPSFLPLILTPK